MAWNTNESQPDPVYRVEVEEVIVDDRLINDDLLSFGRDLVEEARQGVLDPVIGRDKEIRRMVQILSRKTKNNPVLIGEPGCVLPETKIKIRKKCNEGKHKLEVY